MLHSGTDSRRNASGNQSTINNLDKVLLPEYIPPKTSLPVITESFLSLHEKNEKVLQALQYETKQLDQLGKSMKNTEQTIGQQLQDKVNKETTFSFR